MNTTTIAERAAQASTHEHPPAADATGLLAILGAKADEFVAVRRDIHQHPELAYDEHRTSALVAERLEQWGYAVERGIGGTGLVGQLVRGTGQRRLGLRADMDALPIEEATGLAYASSHAGIMHACGHDGHTAMLLAAAEHLARAGRFDGTLNVIFQPAEEGKAGALRMIREGLFERYPCDAVFGMHNMPGHTQGHLVFREGPFMASADNVRITLHGNGGHGAMPHKATDPVVAAASLVMALQTIVSRNVDPQQLAVITVGSLHAGKANNVIPPSATLELSVRALDPAVRDLLMARIDAVSKAQAESYGARAELEWRQGYPVLVNTPAETEFARAVGVELVGADRVMPNGPALNGSEDFAFMLQHVPGCYLLIGNGAGELGSDGRPTSPCMVHNPGFDFNDANLSIGAAYWCLLAERYLTARP